MSDALDDRTWPLMALHEGVEALARALHKSPHAIPRAPMDTGLRSVLDRWMDQAALLCELEAEPADVPLSGIREFLETTRGTVLTFVGGATPTYLIIVEGGRRHVTILGRDRQLVRIRTTELTEVLRKNRVERLRTQNAALLPKVPLSERRQRRLHDRLLETTGAELPIGECWMLRPPPGEPFALQMKRARLGTGLMMVFVLGFVQAGFSAASWLVFGGQSLAGHLDSGRVAAWAMLLLATIPIQVWNNWLLGELALRVSAPFKRRLVDGALRMSSDVIRSDGVGSLLARVNESVLLEGLLVTGGVNVVSAIGDWVLAGVLLSQSASPALAVAAFVVFTLILAALGWEFHRRYQAWTHSRLGMSSDLVERLVGHRTRVVQERRDKWHDDEDRALNAYARVSKTMDNVQGALTSFPRVLPILGAIVVAPLILGQGGTGGAGALVFALVGVASAASALDGLTNVFMLGARGRVAWQSVGPIFESSKPDRASSVVQVFNTAMTQTRTGGTEILIEARDVSFRYESRPRPVLDRCSLSIARGDRILLEGSSGGGKSTLASILAGLRTPESGLLLVKGLDRHSLSPHQWHTAVASAPQFHENHIFTNSLAFNLLLGRTWPPTEADLEEARVVCNELGLGPLLARMPAGLYENVGETGWQLSHGEKSRVYIARAILQRSDVMIFDESFAALDPDTMEQVLRCVMKRAPTLVAIAHP